jgi:hypothetical protein
VPPSFGPALISGVIKMLKMREWEGRGLLINTLKRGEKYVLPNVQQFPRGVSLYEISGCGMLVSRIPHPNQESCSLWYIFGDD